VEEGPVQIAWASLFARRYYRGYNDTQLKGNTMPPIQPTLEDFGNGIFIIWLI
jgi:hypothetical protein